MLEVAVREIDGVEYTCTQFDLRKSLRIITKTARILGGPMGALFANMDDKKSFADMDLKELNLDKVFASLFVNVRDDEVYELLKDMCSNLIAKATTEVQVGGELKDIKFDQHFQGQAGLKRLFKAAKFAMEVNYKDFLSDVANLVQTGLAT